MLLSNIERAQLRMLMPSMGLTWKNTVCQSSYHWIWNVRHILARRLLDDMGKGVNSSNDERTRRA